MTSNSITKNYKSKYIPKWVGGLVLGIFLSVLAFAAIFNLNSKADWLVVFTFIMNGLLSGIMLMQSSKKRPYSLETIHWIFFFFFFFFAPVIQYSANGFPWDLKPTTNELLKANLLLFAWGILFLFGGRARKSEKDKMIENTSLVKPLRINPSILNLFTIISIGIAIYYLVNVGLENLLSRATTGNPLETDSSALRLLFNKATQAFVLFNFVFCALNREKNNFRTIISLVCLLICAFPFGVARNVMAIVYVGLFVLLFAKVLKGRRFTYIFLVGLIIIFPLLNAFRNSSFEEAQVGKALQRILSEFLNEYTAGDYDAYSMLIQTFRYANRFGVEYGMQFIGALLFFIPRTMWKNKPIGSGATIMECFGRDFTNVSCPLPGEFFINFGTVGLLAGAFLIGYVIRSLDNAYWKRKDRRKYKEYIYIDIIYPFLLAALFFMLRGDLMSSLAYTLSYVVVAYFMYFVAVKKGKFGF